MDGCFGHNGKDNYPYAAPVNYVRWIESLHATDANLVKNRKPRKRSEYALPFGREPVTKIAEGCMRYDYRIRICDYTRKVKMVDDQNKEENASERSRETHARKDRNG